ncbi:hypothetical protein Btru_074299 [Bulinus truncatus]|nr:hypothetical protein Btru_074299 [Bulinus truncatus]
MKGFKQNSQSVGCQELHQNKLSPCAKTAVNKKSIPESHPQDKKEVNVKSVDVTNKVAIKEEKISGHNSNKISENRITKTFLKLFPHSSPPKSEGCPKKENPSNADSAKSFSDKKFNKPSKQSLLPETVLASNLASSEDVSSNTDKCNSKMKKMHAKSAKMTDGSSYQKRQSVNKPDDNEIDTSKHYVLKGKEFDHHYRLYYDEETGTGSPNQSPQQECKNKEYTSKKEIHRHNLHSRSSNYAPKISCTDAKLQNIPLPYCYSNYAVQSQSSGSDLFSEITENSNPHTIWPSQKQKTSLKINDAFCHRENATSRPCVPAAWSHLSSSSGQCSHPDDSSPKPSLPSSIVQDMDIGQTTSSRNMFKLIPENITCAIDGQKHSTGIPVMPIILPVVGSHDQQTRPQFNFWPSYLLNMPLTNSESYDRSKNEQCASVVEPSEDTKSEETAVKQDANSPQPESAACDESNSYKPRKSQQSSFSATDVAVHSDDNHHDNTASKQSTEVLHSSNNLSKALVRNANCHGPSNSCTSGNMLVTKTLSPLTICPEIISKEDHDNMRGFREEKEKGTSAYPQMFRQDNIPTNNSRKIMTNTSSQCGLLSRHTLNLVASSNQNSDKSVLNVDGCDSQDPCKSFDFSVKIKPERRSKNKVLVNIGNNPSATTLVENPHVLQNLQAHYDKRGQKHNVDSVIMRKYGHNPRHNRASNSDNFRGFTHNITTQPHQMNRPISHPHGRECLILGNVGKNGTRHWSLHTDLTRSSPNHFTVAPSGQTSGNDVSVMNSNSADSRRTSPISQSSYSAACDETEKKQFTSSRNTGEDQMAQVIFQCTPDLLPLDSKRINEPVAINKEKPVKTSQSLFSRLTQSSLSFFSRDPKPSIAPK